jgi:collagenase-like PrtC family protease
MAQVELLAPAKDLDSGIAAIDSGADAVYIGAARFGARAQAGNSLEDIAALVEHAHTYWARVYVTVTDMVACQIVRGVMHKSADWPAGDPGVFTTQAGGNDR